MKLGVQALLASFLVIAPAAAQQSEGPLDFDWVNGPGKVAITSRAELALPEGYSYLGREDTRRIMELLENIPSDEEYFVAPDDLRWFAVFEYDDSGHVKDDEKIDADAIFGAIREGNEHANRERRRNGWSELEIIGWKYPPFYEQGSNRLAWAILAESEGTQVVNYNTRLLGRTGVMSAVLVADPETLDSAVAEFQSVLEGFEYKPGQRYAEYQPGDKLATYGLAALVAGGAAAAVTKSGIGKAAFKFIGLAVFAALAAVGSFLKRISGRRGTA